MNLTQLILRRRPFATTNLPFICRQKSTKDPSTTTTSSSSSSSSSESDDEAKKVSNSAAVAKLNALLQQIVTEEPKGNQLNLAKPIGRRAQGRQESTKVKSEQEQVVNAVKGVAEHLGGNTQQTESELLMKLLNPVEGNNLSDILQGMKIEREVKPTQSKAEQVRKVLQNFKARPGPQDKPVRRVRRPAGPIIDQTPPQQVDLFGGESLGIFTRASELKDSPQIPTWQRLYQNDLKLAVTHPPANYFQQMILWTEQGKIWRFPIDNEIGLDEEKNVYFADHVFLEEHLEPWCPPRGPIRHFMELVCVGLSRNHYLTVEAKREHIEWYKNYFEGKRALLVEVGAIQSDQLKPKSIE